jgi:hypothetical protein
MITAIYARKATEQSGVADDRSPSRAVNSSMPDEDGATHGKDALLTRSNEKRASAAAEGSGWQRATKVEEIGALGSASRCGRLALRPPRLGEGWE